MALDIPQVYQIHGFMCFQERPPAHPRGSCGQAGAKPLWEYLMSRVEKLGRPDIGLTASGCLGFCAAGPLMVVYPQGIWYRPTSREDVDEIVQSHFVEGNPVERLIIVPH
ncbi:MAG: (2Fe-2S) ferredoxin domain-containing protein [Hyphomicrobiaceae bacterium]|nr:(2Fe-2S) ferredoxin domain-containing protein [Hyphomicrobiaceae bacterium]